MSREDIDRLRSQGLDVETVGDLLGGNGEPFVMTPRCIPPRLEGQPAFPEPGIYFGMPEADYHAIHAASTSGLKRLSTSSMDYWANSVLNVDLVREQRDYFDFGHAIHCLVLEGEACYAARYVIGLEKPQGVLETTDQIKAAIIGCGAKPCTKAYNAVPTEGVPLPTAKKDDWIDQLLDLDPEALIWERMKAAFEASLPEGAEVISHNIDKRVRVAAKMILAQPDIAENFRDGYAEVSVFWYCPATGCPMKARFDYLTMKRIVDLKSFANRGGMPINRAIEKTIANMRYNVQHVIYDEAAEAAKAMIRERGQSAIATLGDALFDRNVLDWAIKWAKTPEAEFMFVFQQTGNAPVTRGRIMPRESMGVFGVTRRGVENLKRAFVANCEVYGAEPWLDIEAVGVIEDEAIPLWATEL